MQRMQQVEERGIDVVHITGAEVPQQVVDCRQRLRQVAHAIHVLHLEFLGGVQVRERQHARAYGHARRRGEARDGQDRRSGRDGPKEMAAVHSSPYHPSRNFKFRISHSLLSPDYRDWTVYG
jgi:hypothetical protein